MVGTRRKPGRMGPYITGYRDHLEQQRYTPGTIRNMLKIIGDLGRWMIEQDLTAEQLTTASIEEFRRFCCVTLRRPPSAKSLDPLRVFLKSQGLLTDPPISGDDPLDSIVAEYCDWLVTDRALAATTIVRYEKLARRFLREASACGIGELTGTDIVAFLLAESPRVSVGAIKGRVAELRSLLKFLYLRGLLPRSLTSAVPPVAGWHDTGIPKSITAAQVQRLLDACDRDDPVQVRDYAMLTLVARLGLRSIEVARLEVGDIDWRGGRIILRGKASREDAMPMPFDVGEAVSTYLRTARPATTLRPVFVTCKAPLRGIRADLVSDVTRRACDRAGLPRVGAHRLRHSLATEMLRRGVPLVDISQVLRHRDLATTSIYAKVDLTTLRDLAAEWPGAPR
ncbi:site-specific integrase [Nocardia gipuzkoensis]|uniref:site-specific integrase n=1 Tax=Nocardia gipuzkoensis TaxID=2749991 RepID=UPI00237DA4CE|nr:site-specific integrase [Nocardia gipuzkoensis]MDE1675103.1 site-specific integrase [Nocardia gipuzkoensis]